MIVSSHFRVGKGEPPEHLKESEGEKSSCFLFVSKVSPASSRHWLNSSGYFHAFEASIQSYLTHTGLGGGPLDSGEFGVGGIV